MNVWIFVEGRQYKNWSFRNASQQRICFNIMLLNLFSVAAIVFHISL